MLFSSIPFLYYFLPLAISAYFLTPKRFKNVTLLLFSLAFYAWGEPRLVVLMLVSVAVGYIAGILMEHCRFKKTTLFVSVAIVLSFLLYFKYADFFISNINALTGFSLPLLKLALPIGISFYTFQILSYIVDVYRGEPAQKDPIKLATFIALFPQLIAGPIVRYSDIARELTERKHSLSLAASGITRFMTGLGKKILIANTLGELCTAFSQSASPSVAFVWLNAISYALQIYFDFSGYSDMAIGLGRVFGFNFLENFNYPFISASITEFWRRWHMSLGSWFRDYVYIPMGGNRVSKPRFLFNIFVVWMLTGFWHGADWNFVIWGVFFAVFLIIEKLFLKRFLDYYRPIGHIYTLLLVLISFAIFASTDLSAVLFSLSGMFGLSGLPAVTPETIYYFKNYGTLLVLAAVGATPLMKNVCKKLPDGVKTVLEPVFSVVMLILCTAFLADGSFNPFLYFRF